MVARVCLDLRTQRGVCSRDVMSIDRFRVFRVKSFIFEFMCKRHQGLMHPINKRSICRKCPARQDPSKA